MQAVLTLPTGMTTIPTSMSKITKNVYFQDSTKNFYKITVLQPMTMFTNNDALTRQNIVMTRYDPAYLALGLLEQNPKMSTFSIPKYLTFANFQPFVDVDVDVDQMGSNGLNAIGNGSVSVVNNANGYWMRANIQKIMDFLEKRIDNMVRIIQQKQYNKVAKKFDYIDKSQMPGQKKTLPGQIIQLLQKQIPQSYMNQLLRSRYHQKKTTKPILLDTFTQQAHREQNYNKNKQKKKAASKPKPAPTIPKNQMSLFQFSSKKQKIDKQDQQKQMKQTQ